MFPPIMLPVFMAVADQTIVASALPAIAGSLGDVRRVSWIVLSYLVANTVAAPVYGRLGDVFGRRRLMLATGGPAAIDPTGPPRAENAAPGTRHRQLSATDELVVDLSCDPR
ncbi:MAG: MFS transporter [Acetobacteraceae bacterium]